jgi:hypothetical protein
MPVTAGEIIFVEDFFFTVSLVGLLRNFSTIKLQYYLALLFKCSPLHFILSVSFLVYDGDQSNVSPRSVIYMTFCVVLKTN